MADKWDKVRGWIGSIFQFGLNGPQAKPISTSVLELRNADDSAYGILRLATPVGDNDGVTKLYADTLSKPMIVKRQADTTSAIPNNTAVRGFVVVTTAGSGASIGDVLYDDGSNSGLMQILVAEEGRTIAVTDALVGGTITFDPDTINMWDEDGAEWVKIADIGNSTGAVRVVRIEIDNTATQDSTFEPPANCRILDTQLDIVTPYSGGATIQVGRGGGAPDLDLLMLTTENTPQKPAGSSFVNGDTDVDWGGNDAPVRITVGGGPAAGDGVVIVRFTTPNA